MELYLKNTKMNFKREYFIYILSVDMILLNAKTHTGI